MSGANNPNTQNIFNTVVASVLVAVVLFGGQAAYSALNPGSSLTATARFGPVVVPPQSFLEPMPNAGCNKTVPYGGTLEELRTRDERLAACVQTITPILEGLSSDSFYHVQLTLENTGRSPEENVRVLAPRIGAVRVSITNREDTVVTDGESVPIGTLAPGETAALTMFSQYSVDPGDVQVFSNRGRTPVRARWGDEHSYYYDPFESLLLACLNSGWAPLFVLIFALGALMFVALIASGVDFVIKKLRGVPATPPTAP